MSAVEPLVRVNRVTKRYGAVTALWKAELEIRDGQFWAIFGPNGAGKSTLLRLLARLSSPTEGNIEYREDSRAAIGYVSHQSLLYGELSGLENLVFFSRLYGLVAPRERALEMLGKMGLAEARDRQARGYSSGMRQRLSLARAMLHDPGLLLLDEPYAGLDQHGSRLLTDVLQGLRAEGRTILLITHNLAEGLALADHVAVLSRGQLVLRSRRDELPEGGFDQTYFRLVEG